MVGVSACYQCAYSTLDRPLWWNMETSGGINITMLTISDFTCTLVALNCYMKDLEPEVI